MVKQLISFALPQHVYLKREAKRLGVSVAELVRRIVDAHMASIARLVVVCLISMLATPAFAEDPAPNTSRSLRIASSVFIASAAADWSTTAICLHRGCVESNPQYAWLQSRGGTAAVVTFGAVSDTVGLWAWNRYVGRKHPKWAALGLYAMAAWRLTVVAPNIRAIQDRARQSRALSSCCS